MTKKEIEKYFEKLLTLTVPLGEVPSDYVLNEMGDKWQEYMESSNNMMTTRARKDFMMGAIMVAKMWKLSIKN